MEFSSNFKLNFEFTIYMWVRLDDIDSGEQALFVKHLAADPYTPVLTWHIDAATSKMHCEFYSEGNTSNTRFMKPTAGSFFTVPTTDWQLLGM
jgi:hypothetical protein